MSDKAISSTTQEFLDVYDIVDDMVLLKDGTASMILQVGTMNFSLLAEQEQDAIIFTYGSLLNSLNYPIQISIQSQTKDATKYLRLLDEQIQKANSDRKAGLIKKYRDFVADLIKERNVLQKNFFVTIPASPGEMGLLTASSVLPGKTVFDISKIEKSIILEKASNLLGPRRDHLISQFNRLGLSTRQLTTQEIIQNFYINYNPEAVEGQEISSSENYTTPLVRASFGRKFMQANPANADPGQTVANNQAQANPPSPGSPPPAVTDQTPTAAPANQPPTANFSPEDILSDKPLAATNQPAVQNTETNNDNPMPENAPVESVAPVAAAQPADNPAELNLNLDANLINTPPAAPVNQEIAGETATVADQGEMPPATSDQASPAPASATPTEVTSTNDSDFTEDITPLQKQFETPVNNTNVQTQTETSNNTEPPTT